MTTPQTVLLEHLRAARGVAIAHLGTYAHGLVAQLELDIGDDDIADAVLVVTAERDGAAGEGLPSVEEPRPMGEAAYHGFLGETTRMIEPYSESLREPILAQLLVAVGVLVGRRAHIAVGADRHYANENVCVAGPSSAGRKGTSLGPVRSVLAAADREFARDNVCGGLSSSGEGLIANLCHPPGTALRQGMPEPDAGAVIDRRRIAIMTELSTFQKAAKREGNTVTSVVRDAWDTGHLSTMTVTSRRVVDAHVGIIAHTTPAEFRDLCGKTDVANGLWNRFLFIAAPRPSKSLPDGAILPPGEVELAGRQLREIARVAGSVDRVGRDTAANELWHATYDALRRGGGHDVLMRAAPHVLRLSLIYALCDHSAVVRLPHLEAALEVWRYASESALWTLGDMIESKLSRAIFKAVRDGAENGATMTDLHAALHFNATSDAVRQVIDTAVGAGRLVSVRVPTRSKPRTVLYLPEYAPAAGDSSFNSYNSCTPHPGPRTRTGAQVSGLTDNYSSTATAVSHLVDPMGSRLQLRVTPPTVPAVERPAPAIGFRP